MKIGHFGSCLSADLVFVLVNDYGCEEVFRIHHNRSDQFVNYFVDKTETQFDYEWLTTFLKPKPETAKDATTFVENQFVPWIGYENKLRHMVTPETDFFENLKAMSVDVILLDNFMDTACCLLAPPETPKKTVFFATHLYENAEEIQKKFVMGPYLTPQESAENWVKICKFFRAAQPNAKIIFTCWSASTSRTNPERTKRILGFYEAFYPLIKDEDVHVIPPVDVPEALTNGPDDWYHMHKNVYKALAGYIFVHAAGRLPSQGQMTAWT